MDEQAINAQKAKALADERAPGEIWLELDPEIYIAASRVPKSERQAQILEREREQARVLTAAGHTVYLLPEHGSRGMKHPDAVVDGMIMEFKTVTGNVRKIGENYKAARLKAENVFLKIDAPLPRRAVTRRLSGVIRAKGYTSGVIWVYFTNTGGFDYWKVDDLR
jgi:hypothetical protein